MLTNNTAAVDTQLHSSHDQSDACYSKMLQTYDITGCSRTFGWSGSNQWRDDDDSTELRSIVYAFQKVKSFPPCDLEQSNNNSVFNQIYCIQGHSCRATSLWIDPTHTPLTVYVKGQGWRCVRIFLVSKSHIEGPNQRCVSMRLNTFRLLYSNCGFWFILKTYVCVLKNKDLHVDPLFYLKRRHRSFKQQRTVFKYFL